MAVSDYSTDPAQNGTINGINIAEGCPPANLNDGLRNVMADLAAEDVVDTSGLMPKAGGTFSGNQPRYSGRGAYFHWNSASFLSGRVFFQAAGGSVPTGMVAGDILLEYE